MKKLFLFFVATILTFSLLAQGNSNGKGKSKDNPSSGKVKDKSKDKDKNNIDKDKNDEHDRRVWEGIGDNSCMKPSKNQPAKVRAAFQRDYPNVMNVRWTKCRGDWTATFNGLIFRSTAVYHANGDRRDTRTPILRDNIPRRILDEIFKRTPNSRVDDAIKIEVPNVFKEIFRVKTMLDGKARYDFFDNGGVQVTYDY